MARKDKRESAEPTATDLGEPLLPTGLVTVLQVVGRGIELRLSPEQRSFSIGSAEGSVDLFVSSPRPDDVATRKKPWQRVSRNHALIQRRLNRLWISDEESKNGITFDGRQRQAGEIVAGQAFGLGRYDPVMLLALDESLVVLRRELQWVLGFDAHAAVDAALQEIAKGDHLLLLGRPGCDQHEIAEQIHRASGRRRGAFAALAATATEADAARVLALAERGTAFVDLHVVTNPLPRAFVAALQTSKVRVIASAATLDQAVHRFELRNANRFEVIDLPVLAERRGDIARLVDTLLVRSGSQRHIGELGAEWSDALARCNWKTNIDGLRADLPKLIALIEHRSVTEAAKAVGISHQALSQWLQRLGLPSKFPKVKTPGA